MVSTAVAPKKASTAELVKSNLDKNRVAIMNSLPKGFNYDRMCRSVINAISTNSYISQCTPNSLFLSVVKGFALGLEPNGALAEGYLVPFKNKGVLEAQFMPSYRGLINLARRTGEIASIYAREVYKNDGFEVQEGLERRLVHKPLIFGDRGEVVGYYAVFTSKDGDADFEIMTAQQIDGIRGRSKAANDGPWVTDYDEMAKKTVIKRLLKRAPMSIELAGAVEQENRVLDGKTTEIIEVEGLEVDEAPQKESKLEQAFKPTVKAEEATKEAEVEYKPSVKLEAEKMPTSDSLTAILAQNNCSLAQAEKFLSEVSGIKTPIQNLEKENPNMAKQIRQRPSDFANAALDYFNSKGN